MHSVWGLIKGPVQPKQNLTYFADSFSYLQRFSEISVHETYVSTPSQQSCGACVKNLYRKKLDSNLSFEKQCPGHSG